MLRRASCGSGVRGWADTVRLVYVGTTNLLITNYAVESITIDHILSRYHGQDV